MLSPFFHVRVNYNTQLLVSVETRKLAENFGPGKVPERLLYTDQISILINGTEFTSDTMMIQSSIIREGKSCTLLAQ